MEEQSRTEQALAVCRELGFVEIHMSDIDSQDDLLGLPILEEGK
jgi:hypothetical protein